MRRLLPALLATAIVSYNARDELAPMAGELDALIEASRTTEVTVTST